jgi:hypothetical protein
MKLLGYGAFSGVYWGRTAEHQWQFENHTGILPTEEEALERYKVRHYHCLSYDIRRIYDVSQLNMGTHNSPRFMTASVWKKDYQKIDEGLGLKREQDILAYRERKFKKRFDWKANRG